MWGALHYCPRGGASPSSSRATIRITPEGVEHYNGLQALKSFRQIYCEAAADGAVVSPVGRSGGHAASLYERMSRPAAIDAGTWAVLGSIASSPEETARAAVRAVQACLVANGEAS